MEKQKIQQHSVYMTAPFYYEAIGTNVSSITDKLVRITAMKTESYAGDIIYDGMGLLEKVKYGVPYDHLLIFRECGVSSAGIIKEVHDDKVLEYPDKGIDTYDMVQAWRLTHEPNENHEMSKTILRRVDIV